MSASTRLQGLSEGKLKLLLLVFFFSLLLPTLILVFNAHGQLKWEVFHRHRLMAEELANRIDGRIRGMIATEEARSAADYQFLVLAGDPDSAFLQRSPLSNYPVQSVVPGLLGHFQVDSLGRFTTPLLPSADTDEQAYGISEREYAQRLSLAQQVREVLSRNRLVQGQPADDSMEKAERETYADEQAGGQMAFDQLAKEKSPAVQAKKARQAPAALGRVEDLELDSSLAARHRSLDSVSRPAPASSIAGLGKREKRSEQTSVPESVSSSDIRITTFESEIDPFEFSMLDSGHFVLYRKVWRGGERTIQGAVIDQQVFVRALVGSAFRDTALSRMSKLIVAYQGDVISAFSGDAPRDYMASSGELSGELLYQTSLSAPLDKLQLIFSITQLPAGAGSTLLVWVALILLLVLCAGCYMIYRLGIGQIRLARQQQDFVSAVSHELKTPLTSIQMYGEILCAGWADEGKKQGYYDFIYQESQRLSRLIDNVLQLARMTRNDPSFDLRPVTVGELMDTIESKIASQVQRAGFELSFQRDEAVEQCIVVVDMDCFIQVFINLVDNAIKFSTRAERKKIEIGCQSALDGTVRFTVRDFGPGIPKGQLKKIFELFYRSENELTRDTVGTGIGLALVHQLALAMNGTVEVSNRQPGAEFSLSLVVVQT